MSRQSRMDAPSRTPLYRDDLPTLLGSLRVHGCVCPATLIGGCHGDDCPRRPSVRAVATVPAPWSWAPWEGATAEPSPPSAAEQPAGQQEPTAAPQVKAARRAPMARGVVLREEDRVEIIAALESGQKATGVSMRLGIPYAKVLQVAHDAGVTLTKGGPRFRSQAAD